RSAENWLGLDHTDLASTTEAVRPDDAVSELERGSEGVAIGVVTDGHNGARHHVPSDGGQSFPPIAARDRSSGKVQVSRAHSRSPRLDQQRSTLERRGHRNLADLERFAVLSEHSCPTRGRKVRSNHLTPIC